MTIDPRRAATVDFDHVSKSYEKPKNKKEAAKLKDQPGAVNDLSLAIPAGKICVLVGPSGCGKTTSLKMVNRLIEPTGGRILLDGADAAKRDVTELRREIGYVIQSTGLFPHQTIIENVGTVPRLLGWPEARRNARSEELMAIVGLDPARYARRYPSQLSGGERQRVGVARALAADPPIMLMDEPFGAVDPIVRERLQDEFLRLQEEIAKTILFVTHDIDEAIKMGDLVAVLQVGGKLAQFGSPADLLASPASEFVARFVGADRGLKRLALSRIDDLTLLPAPMVTVGTDAGEARRRGLADPLKFLILVGPGREPIGWLDAERLPLEGALVESMANPTSPLLNKRTTLRDALSLLLDASVQIGIVTDRTGAVTGLVTIDMIAERMRAGHRAPAFTAGPSPEGLPDDLPDDPVERSA